MIASVAQRPTTRRGTSWRGYFLTPCTDAGPARSCPSGPAHPRPSVALQRERRTAPRAATPGIAARAKAGTPALAATHATHGTPGGGPIGGSPGPAEPSGPGTLSPLAPPLASGRPSPPVSSCPAGWADLRRCSGVAPAAASAPAGRCPVAPAGAP